MEMINAAEKKKLMLLRKKIKSLKYAVVAFSGGTDSALLAKIAYDELGCNSIAVTVCSEFISEHEKKDAISAAKEIGIRHMIIKAGILCLPEISDNTNERCYHCKSHVFKKIIEFSEDFSKKAFPASATIIEGTNADDLSDFRPGLKALKELKISSPFLDAGLFKKDIRAISKYLGLKSWNKESNSCLATRIPQNKKITKKKLQQVEKAESFIKKFGTRQLRVRHFGNTAVIEVLKKDIGKIIKNKTRIIKYLNRTGFSSVLLDLEGYIRGKMNF